MFGRRGLEFGQTSRRDYWSDETEQWDGDAEVIFGFSRNGLVTTLGAADRRSGAGAVAGHQGDELGPTDASDVPITGCAAGRRQR